MAKDDQAPRNVDISTPNMARMYDYALGGKDNFASDRAAVQNLFRLAPENQYVPKANRLFLGKAARFAAEQGVTQFIDLGAGLPSQGSTHEVARQVRPDARVVYVDSDRCKPSCAHDINRISMEPAALPDSAVWVGWRQRGVSRIE